MIFLADREYLLADLELNDDDLDFLHEIQESNRGEHYSKFQLRLLVIDTS